MKILIKKLVLFNLFTVLSMGLVYSTGSKLWNYTNPSSPEFLSRELTHRETQQAKQQLDDGAKAINHKFDVKISEAVAKMRALGNPKLGTAAYVEYLKIQLTIMNYKLQILHNINAPEPTLKKRKGDIERLKNQIVQAKAAMVDASYDRSSSPGLSRQNSFSSLDQ